MRVRALSLFTLIACGAARPPSPDVAFHARVFGHSPNVIAVMRVADTLRDPLYGPYLRRALDKAGNETSIAGVIGHASEIDIACDVRAGAKSDDVSCTSVLHGTDDDPAAIRDGSSALFDSPSPLPSGATEWALAHGHDWALFTTKHAWVFAHGDAVRQTREALSRDAAPPARIDLEPTALFAASVRGSALDARDVDRKALSGSARVIAQSLDTGELVVMPSGSGDVVSRFWLTDEDSAKILEGEMLAAMRPDARCDSGCKLVRAVIASTIDVRRDGSFVAVRLHLPESVLRKLL